MESVDEPTVFGPRAKVSVQYALASFTSFKRGTSSLLQVVAAGMRILSRRLLPRAAVPPPISRTERGTLRAGLESLDERELRSEAIEADLRERLPTIPGEFIAPSAGVINET